MTTAPTKTAWAALIFASGFAAAGCETTPVRVDAVVIRNGTQLEALDVSVVHLPTNVGSRINRILPGKTLALGFEPREVKAQRARLSWKQGARAYQVELPIPDVSGFDGSKGPLTAVYLIQSNGRARIFFEPSR